MNKQMDKIDFKTSVQELYSVLNLERKLVGVRLINTAGEFATIDAPTPKNPLNYCAMVKAATGGHAFKAAVEHFACKSGPRVLGINPTDLQNANGETWTRLGLYANSTVSSAVRHSLTYSQQKKYGVLVQPLENYEIVPDVIVCITIPYNIMRIIQGYAYHYGMPKNIRMIGNQAVCLEATANPYLSQDMNVSMLCIGTRHRTGWKDTEMAVGIPQNQWFSIVDGIMKTINPMESDVNKHRIKDNLSTLGIDTPRIKFKDNYYNKV